MSRRPIQVLVAVASTAALGVVAVAPGTATGATAAANGSGSGATSASRAQLTGLVCQHALLPVNRSISDTAEIRPITGTSKLAVDFRLMRRPAAGGAFTAVHGSGLGTWLTKAAGPSSGDVWRVIHTVSDLSAPAVYHFVVGFRWLKSSGKVLAHATRTSRACHQPELRPDLEVQSIVVRADAANSADDVYRAKIRDAGVTGVRRFLVQLSDQQGTPLSRHTVPQIGPYQTLTVRLVGPLCSSSSPPIVTVDPHHKVHVYSRAKASLAATCPAPSSST